MIFRGRSLVSAIWFGLAVALSPCTGARGRSQGVAVDACRFGQAIPATPLWKCSNLLPVLI
jgi:hypothetical protein